jgi:soluble lytic murein transglycosylase-like protein
MDKLYFGARARRRFRRARAKRAMVVLWLVALGAGVPGATAVLDWTQEALSKGTTPHAITGSPEHVSAALIPAKDMKAELHTEQEKREASPDPIEATAAATSTNSVIFAAASEFGLDPNYLLSVAVCESGLNPSAYNPAGYHGLFQFDQTTWAAYGYGSIYDPTAQARTAARLIAAGQSSRWPNCA